jgi:hypothetical protein
MELCVRRSKNISELKGSGVVLCFLSRCSHSGSVTAASPASAQGARNPIYILPCRTLRYSRKPSSSGRLVSIRK